MRRLIVKDARLVAPYLWLIVPVHALYAIQSLLNPELYFWMSLGAAVAWTPAILAIEWHAGADRFVASLPVTRADIVGGRYASALAGLVAGAALFVLYGHVSAVVPSRRLAAIWQGSPSWGAVDGVAAFLIVGYVAVAAFLPFFFRWGLPLGGGLFSAGATVALSAGALVARLAQNGAGAGAVPVEPSWSQAVRSWLLALSASVGPLAAGAIALAGATVLGVASVRLSVRFYEGRNL